MSARPPYPRGGDLLEYIGGPRDGDTYTVFGGEHDVRFHMPEPINVLDVAELPPATCPRPRVGVYEVAIYGRGRDAGKPPDWFYALKWAGER